MDQNRDDDAPSNQAEIDHSDGKVFGTIEWSMAPVKGLLII